MESVFEIIAEPNRRAILSLLVPSQQSVGEIERQLGMSQPSVSRHLRVLRDAGFVESTVDGAARHFRPGASLLPLVVGKPIEKTFELAATSFSSPNWHEKK